MEHELLKKAIRLANERYSGHFTMFKFTTNWCFMFGTPSDMLDIQGLKGFKTLEDALINAISKEI